jgi:hypothetical protein
MTDEDEVTDFAIDRSNQRVQAGSSAAALGRRHAPVRGLCRAVSERKISRNGLEEADPQPLIQNSAIAEEWFSIALRCESNV